MRSKVHGSSHYPPGETPAPEVGSTAFASRATVYLVITDRNEDFAVVGVFSTREKAEAVLPGLQGYPLSTLAQVAEYHLDEVTPYFRDRLAGLAGPAAAVAAGVIAVLTRERDEARRERDEAEFRLRDYLRLVGQVADWKAEADRLQRIAVARGEEGDQFEQERDEARQERDEALRSRELAEAEEAVMFRKAAALQRERDEARAAARDYLPHVKFSYDDLNQGKQYEQAERERLSWLGPPETPLEEC
jgi:hypothetical protein